MKYRHLLCAASTTLLLGLGSVSAAVVVTNPATPPSTGVIMQQIPDGTFAFSYAWNRNYEIGQSFYADTNLNVTGITIPFAAYQPGAPSKPFTLNVYQTSGIHEAPSAEKLISTQTGNLPSTLTANTYLTFTPDTPISLTAGKYYIFMLVSSNENSSISFPLYNTDAVAQDSLTWYKDTGNYGRYTTRGMTVYLEGTPVVPEPSTVALLAPIVLAALALRRRTTHTHAVK